MHLKYMAARRHGLQNGLNDPRAVRWKRQGTLKSETLHDDPLGWKRDGAGRNRHLDISRGRHGRQAKHLMIIEQTTPSSGKLPLKHDFVRPAREHPAYAQQSVQRAVARGGLALVAIGTGVEAHPMSLPL